MQRPLEGYRIVDFSHVMAGPFATHFLSLLGAEVIKIEPLAGDNFRFYGKDPAYAGMSPAFIAANLGKKSITLDLKSEAGKRIARELIATADVVMENFRPGVIDKLGLGFDACKALAPNVIFCSVSGYGQTGERSNYPALDQVIQAVSGMMSLNGLPADPPLRVGFPVVDTYTGTIAALAILSALLGRERFGCGRRIDVSMLDTTMVLLTSAVTPWLVAGEVFPRTGNMGYSREPTAETFAGSDGAMISLGVTRQNHFATFVKVIGRPDLCNDPRFADGPSRNGPDHADALRAILRAEFRKRPGQEWEALLSEAGIPCGLVRDLPGACAFDELAERGTKVAMDIPGLPDRAMAVLNAGFLFDEGGPEVAPPPALGEHTDVVLAALGYDEAAREALRTAGVTGPIAK